MKIGTATELVDEIGEALGVDTGTIHESAFQAAVETATRVLKRSVSESRFVIVATGVFASNPATEAFQIFELRESLGVYVRAMGFPNDPVDLTTAIERLEAAKRGEE